MQYEAIVAHVLGTPKVQLRAEMANPSSILDFCGVYAFSISFSKDRFVGCFLIPGVPQVSTS